MDMSKLILSFYQAGQQTPDKKEMKQIKKLDEIKEGDTIFLPEEGDRFRAVEISAMLRQDSEVHIPQGKYARGDYFGGDSLIYVPQNSISDSSSAGEVIVTQSRIQEGMVYKILKAKIEKSPQKPYLPLSGTNE